MSQTIRILVRTLLAPAALAAVFFAGQSAASASTAVAQSANWVHFQAHSAAASTVAPQNCNWNHFRVHF